eukprot:1161145-Pelagomonas_calceolata.AAC.9
MLGHSAQGAMSTSVASTSEAPHICCIRALPLSTRCQQHSAAKLVIGVRGWSSEQAVGGREH